MKISFSFTFSIERSGKVFRLSRPNWERLRDQVRQRDGGICSYCHGYTTEGHVDHIIPLSKGGSDELENLVWSCASCNLSKGNDGEPRRLVSSEIIVVMVEYALKKHDGLWSRRKLMDLQLPTGINISRGQYEKATTLLYEMGVLNERPQGGYLLLSDVLSRLGGNDHDS